jgi:hypothetical protein
MTLDGASLFDHLSGLAHPDSFAALVGDLRKAKEIVDDDVTLVRIDFSATAPAYLVVCQ